MLDAAPDRFAVGTEKRKLDSASEAAKELASANGALGMCTASVDGYFKSRVYDEFVMRL